MAPLSYGKESITEMELRKIKGIGEKTEQLFAKAGVCTVEDLLQYYPVHYDVYGEPVGLDQCEEGRTCAVYGMVQKDASVRKFGSKSIITATIRQGDESLQITWFNMPFLRSTIKAGYRYIFRGRIQRKNNRLTMEQPEVFTPGAYEEKLHSMQPVYGLTKGLSNKTVQKAIKEAISLTPYLIEELWPAQLVEQYTLPDRKEAIKTIHYPKDMSQLAQARNRLVFDEFLTFLVGIRHLKESQAKTKNYFPIKEVWKTEEVIESLPYRLTDAQMRVWREIERDLKGPHMMSRLVQGDVGSGKTILAFLAMIMTAENGYQSALMAPTEVLARQHYEGLQKLLKEQGITNITPVLLTGSVKGKQRKDAYTDIQEGTAQIIIGTHALIQDKVEYKNLALVITDEQHRFGVRQRERLAEKGYPPNILVMSATPIPRTLAIILYGDLDISLVDQLPASRLPIKNCVVGISYRPTAYRFIQQQVEEGRQAYVICPMVEASEDMDGENVTDYSKKLAAGFPKNIHVGMLHGQMKPEEKNQIMEAFQKNEIQVLVSTTVVEVGVDVPNASVMLIENAERFGLAQLHQLRGRVGRGAHQSYCIFMQCQKGEDISQRLDILNQSNDGFHIAAEDLKLRGPGDFFGIRQSGEMEFKLADVIQDSELLKQAAQAVSMVPDTPVSHKEIHL